MKVLNETQHITKKEDVETEVALPLYQAEKKDSVKTIKGYYFQQDVTGEFIEGGEEREEHTDHCVFDSCSHDSWEDDEGFFSFMNIEKIKPETLKISFDNGETFRSIAEVQSDLIAMDALRRLKDR